MILFLIPPSRGTLPTPDGHHLARRDVEEARVAGGVDRLRHDVLEAQAVVEGQLARRAPGVLRVDEPAPLLLARVRARADVPSIGGDVTQEERGEPHPAAARSLRPLRVEVDLARAVVVARHAQVVGAPHVEPHLDRVLGAEHLRQVGDELELLLVLRQRAVAAARLVAERGAEAHRRRVAPDEPAREPGREGVLGEVHARDARVERGVRAVVVGEDVHVVLEPTEAEVEDRRRGQRVVEAHGQALVLHPRVAPEVHDARPAAGAERRGAVLRELRVAVAGEDVHAVADPAVDAGVERVAVELLGALGDEVVPSAVLRAVRVRQGQKVHDREGLRRQAVARDDVAGELRCGWPGRPSAGRRC